MSDFLQGDCMDFLPNFPDNFFDIAVVDPPYFSGPEKRGYYGKKISPIGIKRHYKVSEEWKVPDKAYFDELLRVSRHQIIWGCNYFDYHFGPGRIVWDKCNGKNSFSDCEIAYCSLHDSVRLFRYMWNGMFQGKSIAEGYIHQGNKKLNEVRIHPTQKPVNLYRWIVQNYIKSGWKVLDTHVGSASSLIAYEEGRIEYTGYEKASDIYNLAQKRLTEYKAQITIFDYIEGQNLHKN